MLSYFSINVEQRIITLIIIGLMLRVIFWWGELPLTIPEIIWQQTGIKLSEGNLLYRDIYTDLGIIPSLFYSLAYSLGSYSWVAMQVIALILVGIQAFVFTKMAIRTDVFLRKNYIPGLIFIVLAHLSFDFLYPTPELFASTLTLIAFVRTLRYLRDPNSADDILFIGILIGFAALCYLPALLVVGIVTLMLLLYSGTVLREYFLLLFGASIPTIMVALVYILMNAGGDFYNNYLLASFLIPQLSLVSFFTLASYCIIPLLLAITGFLMAISSGSLTNYQKTVAVSFVLYAFVSVLVIYLGNTRTPAQLWFLIPVAAYFISFLMEMIIKRVLAEILFFSFFLLTISWSYWTLQLDGSTIKLANLNKYIVNSKATENLEKGKKILVLGDDYQYYYQNRLATPFLNIALAQRVMGNYENFNTLNKLYESFASDWPEVIIDEKGDFKKMQESVPAIGQRYISTGNANPKTGIVVYQLKK